MSTAPREPHDYLLTCSEKQARVLWEALELYSRLRLGQFDRVLDLFPRGDHAEEARHMLDEAARLVTGYTRGASIHNSRVPDEARIAYDLEQVVRHRLFWDRHRAGVAPMSVHADTPRRSSTTEALATIERAPARTTSQRATESGSDLSPGTGRGAAAPVDGAPHASSTTTCGGAEAPGNAGGGTAAPGPGAEPPRVTFQAGGETP